MNRDEFVSKLKVGSKIINPVFVKEKCKYITITAIGENKFLGNVYDGSVTFEMSFEIDGVWQHYEEPKIPGSNFVNMNNCGEGVFGKGCDHEMNGLCDYCGLPIKIRNPSGNCDHLYYPENVNKKLARRKIYKEECEHEIMFEKKAGDENKAYAECLKCGEWVEVKQAKPKKLYAPAIVRKGEMGHALSEGLYMSEQEARDICREKFIKWPAIPKNGYYEIEEE